MRPLVTGECTVRAIVTLAYLFLVGNAQAQTLPTVDIRSCCLKKSTSPGGVNQDLFATCVDGETATYGELKENWGDYSAQSRRRCLATRGDGGFYGDLQACIEAAEALKDTEGR
jgi:hypothetical protein